MTLGTISGGIEAVTNLSDPFILDIAAKMLELHCKNSGIVASFEGVLEAKVQVGPNGKTYILKVKAKVSVNDAYVYKIFLIEVFVPYIGLPSLVSVTYVEDINI